MRRIVFHPRRGGALPVNVMVARTPAEMEAGLSNRGQLPPNTGMLFVFEGPGTYGFWMKDTAIPLTVYWLDAQGFIVDIAYMRPFSLAYRKPKTKAVAAVELPQEWALANRIEVGDHVQV